MVDPRWLTADEENAWRNYRRMRTLLDLQLARDLHRESGLSEADYDVLSTLTEVPGSSWRASDLARRLLWSSSRLAHQVGRMQRRGLIVRRSDDADRRGAIVSISDHGRQVLQQAAPGHVDSVRRHLIDLLVPEQVARLGEIAEIVIEHLDPADRPPPGDRTSR